MYADPKQKNATIRFNSLKKAESFAKRVGGKLIICEEIDSKYKVKYKPLKNVFNERRV